MMKLLLWLLHRLSKDKQLDIALQITKEVLESKDYSIDNYTAEKLVENVIKSKGNKIVEFLVKD